MRKAMILQSICTAIFVMFCLKELHIAGKLIKQSRKKKPPKISPYRIGKAGMTKYEFGHRFIIDIDAEFCH